MVLLTAERKHMGASAVFVDFEMSPQRRCLMRAQPDKLSQLRRRIAIPFLEVYFSNCRNIAFCGVISFKKLYRCTLRLRNVNDYSVSLALRRSCNLSEPWKNDVP